MLQAPIINHLFIGAQRNSFIKIFQRKNVLWSPFFQSNFRPRYFPIFLVYINYCNLSKQIFFRTYLSKIKPNCSYITSQKMKFSVKDLY